MKTLAERLKYAMDVLPTKKVKGSELALIAGVKPPSVSDWCSGKSKTMEGENLLKVAKYLSVDPVWLATGKGSPQIRTSDTNSRNDGDGILPHSQTLDNNVVQVTQKLLPVLSWVQAGVWTTMETVNLSEITQWLPPLSADDSEECFYLKVVGISNSPKYVEGDYILVDPTYDVSELVSGNLVVVRTNTDATFKKLIIESDGKRYLQALNPDWKPNIIKFDEDTYLAGVVIDAFRPIDVVRPKRVRKS